MKVIIAGGRGFNDYQTLKEYCQKILRDQEEVEIVSGTARGADELGEKFAKESKCPIKRFPANWDKYGKSAGYKRNAEMAQYADGLIAFWDGKSRGTKHMIDLAERAGIEVRVFNY